MGKINILKEHVSSKIAAGEVIEKPVSVVKELVENSIDANSKNILIEIAKGGKKLIRVVDDGNGIEREDIKLAFERHATSKVYNLEDIFNIKTLGFRGEALASIASVSKVEIITKTRNEQIGTKCILDGGIIQKIEDAPGYRGCSIEVKSLFFNTPARLKFLNSNTKEASSVTNFVTKLAIGRPDISFRLINDNKEIFFSSGNGDLREVIAKIYGIDVAKDMIRIEKKFKNGKISGYISSPQFSRGNRSGEIFFVNKRFIKNKGLELSLERAYKTLLTKGRFPIAVIFIDIDYSLVDVNVHPSKIEVKFQEEKQVQKNVFDAVTNVLKGSILIPEENVTVSQTEFYNIKDQKQDIQVKETLPKNEYYTKDYDKIDNTPIKTQSKLKNLQRVSQKQIQQQIPKHVYNSNVYDKISNKNSKQQIQKVTALEQKNRKLNIKKVIGQLFATYIIAEGEDKFFLIDQHAAHERVLFEQYLKNVDLMAGSQQLVTPYTLKLTVAEMLIIEDLIDNIKTMGFDVSIFGKDTILVRSVPYHLNRVVDPLVLRDAIDELNNNDFIELEPSEKFATSLACHTAIRAGENLTLYEMKELLSQLENTENPYTCPHGRPTIISMNLYELEKKFKRVQ